jgi:hypothetical protein
VSRAECPLETANDASPRFRVVQATRQSYDDVPAPCVILPMRQLPGSGGEPALPGPAAGAFMNGSGCQAGSQTACRLEG